jgi:hypothetical protein
MLIKLTLEEIAERLAARIMLGHGSRLGDDSQPSATTCRRTAANPG